MNFYIVLVVLLSVLQHVSCYNNQHLALTKNKGEIAVSWQTPSSLSAPSVEYYAKGLPISTVTGTSKTYYQPAGYVNNAVLTSLIEDTTYYFRCLNTTNTWTDWNTFKTPKSSFSPFVVPVYGDMGITNSEGTIKQLHNITSMVIQNGNYLGSDLPFFLHIGDISYADDRNSDEYEKVWNEWFNDMQFILTHIPYMVLPGNHEHESGKPDLPYSQYFVDYNYRFNMPDFKTLGHNMWWSFDFQNVHVVAISTETDFKGCQFSSKFGDQLAWLEKDLIEANRNRKTTPWIVAVGHRPLYTSASDSYMREYLVPVRDAFEDLFHKYGVDLYICGHVHSYERTYPVYKDKRIATNYTNIDALAEVVVGSAGNVEGIVKSYISPVADWSAVIYDKSYAYGLLNFASNTKLTWQLHSSVDNSLLDSFTITK